MYTLKAGGCHAVSCIPINDQATHANGYSNGSMVGNPGDPMYSLTATDKHVVAVGFDGNVARTLTARHDSSPCADRGMNVVAISGGFRCGNSPQAHSTTSVVMAHGQANAEVVADGCPALTCNHEQPILFNPAMTVRRLTPLECERLQGFPDGFTDIEKASDSARYKALGNSLAIPTAEFVIEGIAEVAQ